jgi:hypothetical protein
MNIFSLAEDPVNGTLLNSTCAAKTGIEYVNFAFVTKNGRPTATPNPVQSTTATFTPDPNKDPFMNSDDNLKVSLKDTPHGLQAVINDQTSGQKGSMTASAANGFGQVQYDPTGTSCVNLPYDFHPMYSTSSEQTRVIWAAHTYNISFTSEIGHFENCNGPNPIPATPFGLDANGNPVTCPAGNTEGFGDHVSPTDGDDDFCFPGTEALRIHINGCTDTNTGFDSLGYQPVWPDGNTALHPESILFTSPRTGPGDSTNYSRVAFEADLPRIETNTCNRLTGAGCTLIPTTDKGTRPPSTRSSARSRTVSRACRAAAAACGGSATTCPVRPATSAATRSTGRCCPAPTWPSAGAAPRSTSSTTSARSSRTRAPQAGGLASGMNRSRAGTVKSRPEIYPI